eukprot:gnl/TRDRNA2_/TRDRNA2_130067_c0_seq1.p1 gnl/TRDRNA2_/TRDRNA2_130067_c0~~gnl/TRDRNA2_/TRDRNA2_130067_c0_seq1.p1  ORF type:complete len:774 (+),score=155.23 gnl/TRDRNA2_/TRDRNA2_130067_c0_seq1:93-2414(+)
MTGCQEGTFDAARLFSLVSAASSAAASTASAVDAVVQEAVVFFGSMPPQFSVSCTRTWSSAKNGEEVFRDIGRQARSCATDAAETCSEIHAYLLRDTAAVGGNGSPPFDVAAAVVNAARHTSDLTEGTASIARQAAQLCTGILEEAVQANASPLARETAKRCAERALHTVEAASVAEEQSAEIQKFLSFAHVVNTSQGAAFGGSTNAAQTSPPSPPMQMQPVAAAGQQQPQVARPPPAAAPPHTGVWRRWWEDGSEAICGALQAAAGDAPIARAPGGVEETLNDTTELEERLAASVRNCMDCQDSEEFPVDVENDECLFRVAVDWRLGLSVALGLPESSVLSDVNMACLVRGTCRIAPNGMQQQLPAALVEAAQHCGGQHLPSLALALRRAVAAGQDSDDADINMPAEQAPRQQPFVGPFRQAQNEMADAKLESGDWDKVFDSLGWSISSTGTKTHSNSCDANLEAPLYLDPEHAKENWSMDNMTLRQLHIMSMHSRSKQRCTGVVKHQAAAPAAAKDAEPAPQANTSPASLTTVSAEEIAAVRDFLAETLGDWEQGPADSGADHLMRPASRSSPLAVGPCGTQGVAGGGSGRDAPKRTKKKRRPLGSANIDTQRGGPHTNMAAATAGPTAQQMQRRPLPENHLVHPAARGGQAGSAEYSLETFGQVPLKGDPFGPLYVNASPQRWASEHCEEVSNSGAIRGVYQGFPLQNPAQAYVPNFQGYGVQRGGPLPGAPLAPGLVVMEGVNVNEQGGPFLRFPGNTLSHYPGTESVH